MDQKTFLAVLIVNLALALVFIYVILSMRKRDNPTEELWRKRMEISDAYLGQSKNPIIVFVILCVLATWLYDIMRKLMG